MTSGTVTFAGSFATVSVIVVPFGACVSAAGLCESTVPGSSLSVSCSRHGGPQARRFELGHRLVLAEALDVGHRDLARAPRRS